MRVGRMHYKVWWTMDKREPATHTQAVHRDADAGRAIYTTRRGEQEQRAQPPYCASDDIDGGSMRVGRMHYKVW